MEFCEMGWALGSNTRMVLCDLRYMNVRTYIIKEEIKSSDKVLRLSYMERIAIYGVVLCARII